MQYLEATVLAERIKSEYPQYSNVIVIPVGKGYGVLLARWYVKHDKYCCVEYEKFMQRAEEHGFDIDVIDNGMLLKPEEQYTIITTPNQWTLVEILRQAEETSIRPRTNKGGRPRKQPPA